MRYAESSVTFRSFAAGQASLPVHFDGFRTVVIHDTADPEVIIAEYDLAGTVTTTNRQASASFVLVLRVRDGRIVHLREYQNVLGMAAALGQLPEALAGTEQPDRIVDGGVAMDEDVPEGDYAGEFGIAAARSGAALESWLSASPMISNSRSMAARASSCSHRASPSTVSAASREAAAAVGATGPGRACPAWAGWVRAAWAPGSTLLRAQCLGRRGSMLP